MWANAQRDGRPAEYRWRPLLNPLKLWLTLITGVPCSNAANTGERKTARLGRKVNFAPDKILLRSMRPRKCIHSATAQETAKHHVQFGWLPLSDVAAVRKPRRETR